MFAQLECTRSEAPRIPTPQASFGFLSVVGFRFGTLTRPLGPPTQRRERPLAQPRTAGQPARDASRVARTLPRDAVRHTAQHALQARGAIPGPRPRAGATSEPAQRLLGGLALACRPRAPPPPAPVCRRPGPGPPPVPSAGRAGVSAAALSPRAVTERSKAAGGREGGRSRPHGTHSPMPRTFREVFLPFEMNSVR